VAVLVTGILMVGNMAGTFKRKMKVVSFFEDVSGLQAGNNVWFSGVKIGTVSSLHFFGVSQVKVEVNIEIKAQEYIRKDAKIKISTDGLIGNKILVIYGGSPKASEVQEGDTLEVEKTFTSEDMINMLQENNKNILAITADFKAVSQGIAAGQGTLGKLLGDDQLYNNINATAGSMQAAAAKAALLVANLHTYTQSLDKEGTLAHELANDTVVFASMRATAVQLQNMADTASALVAGLKEASANTATPVGVLLHDEEAGASIKATLLKLESTSVKLDENMEALQHNFLLRRYFKKKAKAEKDPQTSGSL
jgi:phospholipid/cholesterol/gamma-HCH transport system substrate-binding protein